MRIYLGTWKFLIWIWIFFFFSYSHLQYHWNSTENTCFVPLSFLQNTAKLNEQYFCKVWLPEIWMICQWCFRKHEEYFKKEQFCLLQIYYSQLSICILFFFFSQVCRLILQIHLNMLWNLKNLKVNNLK